MAKNHPSAAGSVHEDTSRRTFMAKLTEAVLAGASNPLAASGVQSEVLVPELGLPEAIDGEHPYERMMADLRRALKKPSDQRQWAMVIDLRKCTGCNGCNVACITENKLPPGVAYRPVLTETHGTFPNVARRFIPRPCMQCEDPPCVPVCPVNATWRRSDGIVVVDYDQCIGCRYCITACPYTSRYFDSGFFYGEFEGGERQPYEQLPSPEYKEDRVRADGGSPIGNARKCHFCIHRIEQGELPACVVSCMGWANFFGDMSDPESLVAEKIGQPNVMRLKEDLGTKPRVYYLV